MQEASSTPYLVSMAIKAAELQGRKAGSKFCENSKNTLKMYQILTANYYLHSNIDVEEFKKTYIPLAQKGFPM